MSKYQNKNVEKLSILDVAYQCSRAVKPDVGSEHVVDQASTECLLILQAACYLTQAIHHQVIAGKLQMLLVILPQAIWKNPSISLPMFLRSHQDTFH
jgi:hypothetical protein